MGLPTIVARIALVWLEKNGPLVCRGRADAAPAMSMITEDELRVACAKVTKAFELYPHLSEAVYQRALQIELQESGHTVVAEVVKPVMYEGMHVGTVRADLVVHNKHADDFVLELKRVPKILPGHIDQLRTYMALTAERRIKQYNEPCDVRGAVVNFGRAPAEIHFEDTPVWANGREPSPPRSHSRSRSRSRSRSPERATTPQG